jgi:hypothetical protein
MTGAPLFFPGQVWTLKAPADPAMRVRIGAVESLGGRIGVHIEIANAPLPKGFEAEDGVTALSIGHVPIAAGALEREVVHLESSGAVMSRPFDEGLTAWRAEHAAGRAGFFDAAPHEIVEMLFEAMKQSSRPTLQG